MRCRALGLLCALVAAVTLAPAAALADGDPASDVLLGENVFYPYQPPVSAALQRTLNGDTTAAARAHFPVKVALIASPIDLGVIPQMFGKPQQYATFLDQEISYPSAQPLLVVMAAGYGLQGLPPAARSAVASLRPPSGLTGNDLARAAVTAVHAMAKAAGHRLPSGGGAGGAGHSAALIAAGLALAAAGTAAALIAARRRALRPATLTASKRRRTRGTGR